MGKKVLKNQLVNFEIQLTDTRPKPDNPMFTLATARILYTGNNRNGSHLTDDSVLKALPTLKGVPVVGEYDKDKDNFKGHGGEVVINDEGVEFIDTTTPWGYVSETSKFFYEEVTDDDGVTRTYLVADTVNLWTGRYPQLNALLEEGKFNQSMEIEVQNGEFAIIDGEEVFRIDEFIFSALCILGVNKDSDPYGHVEPCFEGASITINTNENSIFSKRYSLMMEEIKNPERAEGGKSVELTIAQKKFLLNTIKEHVAEEKEGAQPHENMYLTTDESHVFYLDLVNDKVMKAEFTIEGEDVSINFETAMETQAEGEVEVHLENARLFATEQKNLFNALETVKNFEDEVSTLKTQAGEFQAKINELTAEKVDVEAIKAQVQADFEAQHKQDLETALEQVGRLTSDLEAKTGEFTILSEEKTAMKAELEELRTYKSQVEAEAIKEKFSEQLPADIIETVLKESVGKTTKEIETALFVEIGKQNFSMKKDNEKKPKHTGVLSDDESKDTPVYGGLFEKHKKQ